MAWSGKRLLTAGVLVPVLLASCGDGPTTVAPTATGAEGATVATLAMDAPGPRLPLENPAGEAQTPVAAVNGGVVLAVGGGETGSPQTFVLWDPATGATRTLWTGAAGQQDIVMAAAGDWLATVRTGIALPFPDWELVVRNAATGESRTIARAEGDVAAANDIQPGLPFGFAPRAVIDGARVAWIQYTGTAGAPARELRTYDLTTGGRATLDTVTLAGGDLDSVAAGGGRTAWLRVDAAGQRFVLREADGASREIPVAGAPFQAALDATGRYLAWDDSLTTKRLLDLESGEASVFATDEGWGMSASGGRFSWAPAAAYGGAPGYFDAATGTTYLLERRDGVRSNYAALLGPWFAWQSAGPRGDGSYHFTWHGQS
ncbi:MAG: hypothetical protein IT302_04780 [Dehalococcoidia bacterium]|nr:hypothetical protein [Dehalococcoidia bacterium]